mmetsp:Transcript_96300/g.272244  ORF Transcript_96300/g.272244 Transcript_96300/m.272244 type:complete len:234 (+) Transcript_96300:2011-2712(+)
MCCPAPDSLVTEPAEDEAKPVPAADSTLPPLPAVISQPSESATLKSMSAHHRLTTGWRMGPWDETLFGLLGLCAASPAVPMSTGLKGQTCSWSCSRSSPCFRARSMAHTSERRATSSTRAADRVGDVSLACGDVGNPTVGSPAMSLRLLAGTSMPSPSLPLQRSLSTGATPPEPLLAQVELAAMVEPPSDRKSSGAPVFLDGTMVTPPPSDRHVSCAVGFLDSAAAMPPLCLA